MIENKNIIILSPEKWGVIKLSKHEYAIKLANNGNNVFFTFIDKKTKGIVVEKTEINNLFLIKFKPGFIKLKSWWRWLFDKIMNQYISQILKIINCKIDILWCFDYKFYSNLDKFSADYVIYHPVDVIKADYQVKPATKADVILSVSHSILKSFDKINVPKYFINHGLSNEFEQLAKKNLRGDYKPAEILKSGFWGNLMLNFISFETYYAIIKKYPDIEFHFWGPYKLEQSNIGGYKSKEIDEFILFLQQQKNVFLHNAKTKTELVRQIADIDIFTVFYSQNKYYDRSNSHKILEYLSTGKVIVSNEFDVYRDFHNIILMTNNYNEQIDLFSKAVNNINFYNKPEMMRKRIELALNYTYSKQIQKIEHLTNGFTKNHN